MKKANAHVFNVPAIAEVREVAFFSFYVACKLPEHKTDAFAGKCETGHPLSAVKSTEKHPGMLSGEKRLLSLPQQAG